ncbi:MAG: hypothetical protein U0T82_07760 [Bacteroidales bacterium]
MKFSTLLTITFLLITVCAYSQDTIVTMNNERIYCKVIGDDSASYHITMDKYGKTINTFINKSQVQYVIFKKNFRSTYKDRSFVVQLDLLIPAVGFEARLADETTFQLSYQPGLVVLHQDYEKDKSYIIKQFKGGFRIYRDLDTRFQEGLNTSKFSGSYITFPVFIALESPVSNGSITFGPALGLQRTWGEIVHFSIELGGGFTTAKNDEPGFTFFGDLKFGFAF